MANGVLVPLLPLDDAVDIVFTLLATKRAATWKS